VLRAPARLLIPTTEYTRDRDPTRPYCIHSPSINTARPGPIRRPRLCPLHLHGRPHRAPRPQGQINPGSCPPIRRAPALLQPAPHESSAQTPVFIRTDHGNLCLILSNRNAVLDAQLAATPEEANRVAIMMLASRDVFDIGDVLICLRADGDSPHEQGAPNLLPPTD
jgi:hypothetical protein